MRGITAAGLVAALATACSPYHGTPAAAAAVVSGTVTYRERSALPDDAVVRVQLADISRQDVAATTVAQATLRPAGRQVPLPFELSYDRT